MRVLVVEDDDAIRSVLERGLRAEGFEVDTCADGAEGCGRRSTAATRPSCSTCCCPA
jgi:DNA-binding response OmpR family regulator